ncbi:hypothetical protein [Microcoleus sp. herbarium12]|uniref:hypothetical protein n=1 Tax=Microcoleus sp. herbarium12 TaxID=3055437 RepID=UPI002FD37C11
MMLFKPVEKIYSVRLAHVFPVSVKNYSCTIAPMNDRHWLASTQTLPDGCWEISMQLDRASKEGVE